MRSKLRKSWLLLVLPLIWFGLDSAAVTAYVHSVKSGDTEPVLKRDELKDAIDEGVKVRNEEPIDAREDRIWKAIPGYNGLVVDKESTYRVAKKKGRKNPAYWIMKEKKPKVTLDDLGSLPIYRGNENKPMAALMVNVAWGTEYLPKFLQILDQKGVSATFFLDGSWLKKHPEMAREIKRRGHELGNHGYSHPLMSRISEERVQKEISKTEALIRETTGVESRFFAPPAGDFNSVVVKEAGKMGMKTVLWTVDTVDWRPSSSPEWMVQQVRNKISNGSLILTHPTDRTVKALPQIISTVKQKGIKMGTVNDVLSSKRVDLVEPIEGF